MKTKNNVQTVKIHLIIIISGIDMKKTNKLIRYAIKIVIVQSNIHIKSKDIQFNA